MTDWDTIKAFEMRVHGCSYQTIANEMGYTKQNVHSALHRVLKERAPYRRRARKISSIYPAINAWLYENGMTVRQLSAQSGIGYQTLWNRLHGKSRFKQDEIIKLVDFTGLTFGDIFCKGIEG